MSRMDIKNKAQCIILYKMKDCSSSSDNNSVLLVCLLVIDKWKILVDSTHHFDRGMIWDIQSGPNIKILIKYIKSYSAT